MPDPLPPQAQLAEQVDELTKRVNTLTIAVDRLADRVGAEVGTPQVDVAELDNHIALIARNIQHLRTAMDEREDSPLDFQEMAILQQIEQWFEDTNTRMAEDVERVKRDLYRFDQAILEMQERLAALPEQVIMQQPAARLDQAIIAQIEQRLEEATRRLADDIHEQLTQRLVRFEALSQATMSLVGEPIDKLTAKLNDLAEQREPAIAAADRITAIEQAQVLMATSIAALRQDSLEREALLRHVLDTLSHKDS